MRVGVRMLYGGMRSPFSPNSGTAMQLMSRIFSPTFVPPAAADRMCRRRERRCRRRCSARPHRRSRNSAATIRLPQRHQQKPRRIGMPLAIEEMPDSCQPFEQPAADRLSIAALGPVGQERVPRHVQDVRAIRRRARRRCGSGRTGRSSRIRRRVCPRCGRMCRRRSTGGGGRSAGSASPASSRSRTRRGNRRAVMPLSALNCRNVAEVGALARDRHAVDRHRQVDAVERAAELITPYGMTLPLLRLTRSRRGCRHSSPRRPG